MALPHWVARLNARFTNRIAERLVRRSRHFAVVHHVGRVTGRSHRTPLFAFGSGDRRWIALTYGPRADWVRNVLSGPATIEQRGTRWSIEDPSLTDRGDAWEHIGRWSRIGLRLLRIRDFLTCTVEPDRIGSGHDVVGRST